MKVVDRETFLKMPKGTVFCKIDGHGLGHNEILCIKTTDSDYTVDFRSFPIALDVHSGNSEDWTDRWTELHEGKEIASEPFDTRDGLFDLDEKFVIYSKDEILQMANYLIDATIGVVPYE